MEWIIESTQTVTRWSVVYADTEEQAMDKFMEGDIAEVSDVDESFPDIRNAWPAADED